VRSGVPIKNTDARLKSNIMSPPKNFGRVTPLVALFWQDEQNFTCHRLRVKNSCITSLFLCLYLQ